MEDRENPDQPVSDIISRNAIKREHMKKISKSWGKYQDLQKKLTTARQEFIQELMDAADHDVTQAKMAECCVTGESHITRGRISQFIMDGKQLRQQKGTSGNG